MIKNVVTKKLLAEAGNLVLQLEAAQYGKRLLPGGTFINYLHCDQWRMNWLVDRAKARYKRRVGKLVQMVKDEEEHGAFEIKAVIKAVIKTGIDLEQRNRKLASEAYKLWRSILDLKHDYILDFDKDVSSTDYDKIKRAESRAYRRWNRRLIKLPDSEIKNVTSFKPDPNYTPIEDWDNNGRSKYPNWTAHLIEPPDFVSRSGSSTPDKDFDI